MEGNGGGGNGDIRRIQPWKDEKGVRKDVALTKQEKRLLSLTHTRISTAMTGEDASEHSTTNG